MMDQIPKETLRQILMRFSSCPESASCDLSDIEISRIRADRYNSQDGNLNEVDGYDCSVCRNRGYIAVAYPEDIKIGKCRCMSARHSIRILKKSGLEDMIQRYRFDTYSVSEGWQRAALESAKRYAENPAGWYVISGKPGTGKTHLCAAICRELMLRGEPTRYMMWRDAAGLLKFSDDKQKRAEALDDLKSVKVLYIDDFLKVGKREKPTSADVSLAFEILNARYNRQDSITVISTELTAMEIIDIDEAVGSRIYERSKGGQFLQLSAEAKNWRLRNNDQ